MRSMPDADGKVPLTDRVEQHAAQAAAGAGHKPRTYRQSNATVTMSYCARGGTRTHTPFDTAF
ncbi:hypothetical protein DF275_09065 [Listeria monocytogenes]|nr:hypothetical protein DF275_09065 [Listeria monocytogenes]